MNQDFKDKNMNSQKLTVCLLYQNRRQTVYNRGAWGPKNWQNSAIYSVSFFYLRGLGALFVGAKPTKAPRGDATVLSTRQAK